MGTKTLLGGPAGQVADALGDYSMGMNKLTDLATCVTAYEAANKKYVDETVAAIQAGLAWKEPVRAATVANTVLAGLLTIDGVPLAATERVLVKDQADPTENGIYLAAAGVWARSADTDEADDLAQAAVFVEEGATQADSFWVCVADLPITLGFTALTFTHFASLSDLVAGAGLTKVGNQVDVVAADASLLVNPNDLLVQRDPAGAIDLTPSGLAVAVDGVTIQIIGNQLIAPAAVAASSIFPAVNVGIVPILAGQPVALGPGGVVLADANTVVGEVVGLAVADVLPTASGIFQVSGVMVQPDWTAIVGAVTLTPGRHYLSLVSGKLSTVAVVAAPGRISQSVGVAVDSTTLTIRLSDPVVLA